MNFTVLEETKFEELQNMFRASCQEMIRLSQENAALRTELLTAEEVAAITKFSTATIIRKKEEIGFVPFGTDIRFERSAVENWIKNNRINPRRKYN